MPFHLVIGDGHGACNFGNRGTNQTGHRREFLEKKQRPKRRQELYSWYCVHTKIAIDVGCLLVRSVRSMAAAAHLMKMKTQLNNMPPPLSAFQRASRLE